MKHSKGQIICCRWTNILTQIQFPAIINGQSLSTANMFVVSPMETLSRETKNHYIWKNISNNFLLLSTAILKSPPLPRHHQHFQDTTFSHTLRNVCLQLCHTKFICLGTSFSSYFCNISFLFRELLTRPKDLGVLFSALSSVILSLSYLCERLLHIITLEYVAM